MTIVGVISDTHGLLRPQALAYLEGCDLIVHAGDIGTREVICGLEKIAAVKAVRGNVDKGAWADAFPETDTITVAGKSLYLLHNLHELGVDPVAAGIDVVISGHSHTPKQAVVDGVLYLNPGSAGPRRFTLPIALARLTIDGARVYAEIHEIPV